MKKHKTVRLLRVLSRLSARWEAWLLFLLLVTVFGMAVSQPHGMVRSSKRLSALAVEDPYDIRIERSESSGSRNGIETGL